MGSLHVLLLLLLDCSEGGRLTGADSATITSVFLPPAAIKKWFIMTRCVFLAPAVIERGLSSHSSPSLRSLRSHLPAQPRKTPPCHNLWYLHIQHSLHPHAAGSLPRAPTARRETHPPRRTERQNQFNQGVFRNMRATCRCKWPLSCRPQLPEGPGSVRFRSQSPSCGRGFTAHYSW